MDPPLWTDVWQTIFLGGQLALLLVAAVFGWRQLREATTLREEQTRPFVVIDLDSPKRPFFDLVVKNIGTTMARNVTFEFGVMPETTISQASLDGLKMFREGISTLPPGKEIRTLFDSGIQRHKSDLPDTYEVTVAYTDPTGKRHYEERIDLDFGIYWNRMSMTTYGVHDMYKELKKLREELGKWTASLGGGLMHVTPKDLENRQAEIERMFEERQSSEEDA